MAQTSVNLEDREAALSAFARSRDGFEAAYHPVPDDALRYVPPGEDYTLGGLVPHVTDTIEHYARVLGRMTGASFGQVRVIDPDDETKRRRDALTRDGYGATERVAVFAELRAAHDVFADMLRALAADDYTRPAPVLYGADAAEPYLTRPSDIVGWLIDHYREHIAQVTDLLARWKASQA